MADTNAVIVEDWALCYNRLAGMGAPPAICYIPLGMMVVRQHMLSTTLDTNQIKEQYGVLQL